MLLHGQISRMDATKRVLRTANEDAAVSWVRVFREACRKRTTSTTRADSFRAIPTLLPPGPVIQHSNTPSPRCALPRLRRGGNDGGFGPADPLDVLRMIFYERALFCSDADVLESNIPGVGAGDAVGAGEIEIGEGDVLDGLFLQSFDDAAVRELTAVTWSMWMLRNRGVRSESGSTGVWV